MQPIVRSIVYQLIEPFVIAVGTTPTQVFPQQTKSDLIDSFTLSLDAAAANNVFIGGQAVTIANGLEIIAGGGPLTFRIRNQWQQYEVQEPLVKLADKIDCNNPMTPRAIPFVIWDLSQIYLVAVAATNIRCAPWRAQFI